MTVFKNGDIYSKARMNANDWNIISTLTITANIAYNPLRVCYAAYGSHDNLDALLLCNAIKNPYKELYPGRVIKVPVVSDAINASNKSSKEQITSVKVKNATVNGNKITY
jgi:hypothetical protein